MNIISKFDIEDDDDLFGCGDCNDCDLHSDHGERCKVLPPDKNDEPQCHCASPSVHDPNCAWKKWKDGQKCK